MDVEITPEPSNEERQAILEMLWSESEEAQALSPWRRAGLEPPEDEDYATAPPRQSRGATRA